MHSSWFQGFCVDMTMFLCVALQNLHATTRTTMSPHQRDSIPRIGSRMPFCIIHILCRPKLTCCGGHCVLSPKIFINVHSTYKIWWCVSLAWHATRDTRHRQTPQTRLDRCKLVTSLPSRNLNFLRVIWTSLTDAQHFFLPTGNWVPGSFDSWERVAALWSVSRATFDRVQTSTAQRRRPILEFPETLCQLWYNRLRGRWRWSWIVGREVQRLENRTERATIGTKESSSGKGGQ
jgi:hypothetical protein